MPTQTHVHSAPALRAKEVGVGMGSSERDVGSRRGGLAHRQLHTTRTGGHRGDALFREGVSGETDPLWIQRQTPRGWSPLCHGQVLGFRLVPSFSQSLSRLL